MRRSEHIVNPRLDTCIQERCYTMHVKELRKLDHQHAIDSSQPEIPPRLQVYNQQNAALKREALDKANYLYTLIPRRHGKVGVRAKKKGKSKKQSEAPSELADDFFLTQKPTNSGLIVNSPETPRKRPPNMWDFDEQTKEIAPNANTAQMQRLYPSMMSDARRSQPVGTDRSKIEKFNSKYYKPSRIADDDRKCENKSNGFDEDKRKQRLTFPERRNQGRAVGSGSGTVVDIDPDDESWKQADPFEQGIENDSDADVSLHPLLMQGNGEKKPTSLLDQVRGNDDKKGSQVSPSKSPAKLAPMGAGAKSAMTPSPVRPLLSGMASDQDQDGTDVVKPRKKWKRVKRRKKGAQTSGADEEEQNVTGGNEHGPHKKVVKKVRLLRKINGKYVDASLYDEEATKSSSEERRVIRTRTVVKRYRVPSSSLMDGSDEDEPDGGDGKLHDGIGEAAALATAGVLCGQSPYQSARSGVEVGDSPRQGWSARQGDDAGARSSRSQRSSANPGVGESGGVGSGRSAKSPRETADSGLASSRRSGSPGREGDMSSRGNKSQRETGDDAAGSSRSNGSPGKGSGGGASSRRGGSPRQAQDDGGDSSKRSGSPERGDLASSRSNRSPRETGDGTACSSRRSGSPERGDIGSSRSNRSPRETGDDADRSSRRTGSPRNTGTDGSDSSRSNGSTGGDGAAGSSRRSGSPDRESERTALSGRNQNTRQDGENGVVSSESPGRRSDGAGSSRKDGSSREPVDENGQLQAGGSPDKDSRMPSSRRTGSPRDAGEDGAGSSRRSGSPRKEGVTSSRSQRQTGSSRKAGGSGDSDYSDYSYDGDRNSPNAKRSSRSSRKDTTSPQTGTDTLSSGRTSGRLIADVNDNSQRTTGGRTGSILASEAAADEHRSSRHGGRDTQTSSRRDDDRSYAEGRRRPRHSRWQEYYSDEDEEGSPYSQRYGRRYRSGTPNSVRSQIPNKYGGDFGFRGSGRRRTWRSPTDKEFGTSPSARTVSPMGRSTLGTMQGRRIPFTSLYRDKEEVKKMFLDSPSLYDDSQPVSFRASEQNVYGQIVDQQIEENRLLPVSGMLTMVQVDRGLRSANQNSVRETARSRAIPKPEAATTRSDSSKCHNEDVRFI